MPAGEPGDGACLADRGGPGRPAAVRAAERPAPPSSAGERRSLSGASGAQVLLAVVVVVVVVAVGAWAVLASQAEAAVGSSGGSVAPAAPSLPPAVLVRGQRPHRSATVSITWVGDMTFGTLNAWPPAGTGSLLDDCQAVPAQRPDGRQPGERAR